jgi:hypothetical protein
MTLPSDVHEQIQEELVPIAGVIVNDLLIVVMAVVVVVVVDIVGIPDLQVPNNNQNFLRPAESDIQSVSIAGQSQR